MLYYICECISVTVCLSVFCRMCLFSGSEMSTEIHYEQLLMHTVKGILDLTSKIAKDNIKQKMAEKSLLTVHVMVFQRGHG